MEYYESINSFRSLGDVNPTDNDRLSSKADYGSDSGDSMSFAEPWDSSTPHTGSPVPFDSQVKGIAGWAEGSAKSDGSDQLGAEILIPRNSEEAESISQGHDRALETLKKYESTPYESTNTSIITRRRHVDVIGGPQNTNVTSPKIGDDKDPFDGRFAKRTANDPEEQELVDGLSTSQQKYHYGIEYTVLVIALGLGIVLYRVWTW